jgi:hypothetical protein
MADELGKIEKPSVDQFQGSRKLYLVPLIYIGTDAPADYKEKYERYWQQVSEQITGQELKVGKVTRIYHETLSLGGVEGLKVVEQVNALSHRIVKEKVEQGAVLEPTEVMDLFDECMDWQRCLMMGFFSRKVADTVSENYRQAAKKRYDYISNHITETLGKGEVALLFIQEGQALQFPQDIDVFSVVPPALDEIHRWLRDRQNTAEDDTKDKKVGETETPEKS